MSTPLIVVDGITVRLGDRWLLQGSSWRIDSGELWTLVGPNGAGKTTLAKAVAGLLPVVQGKIDYPGLAGRSPMKAIAYVASDARRELWRRERQLEHGRQFAGRFGDATTVGESIRRSCADSHPRPGWDGRLAAAVERLCLEDLLDKPLTAISTGEMSRVLVARELVRGPEMLILDEPFDGLDPSGRRSLTDLLDRLASSGLPMVTIVHRPEEMLPATTHVLTLEAGRIVGRAAVAPGRRARPATARRPESSRPQRRFSPCARVDRKGRFSSEPLVDMQAVTVRYGDAIVLDRVTWRVEEGQHWAVTGPNGAGKSTVLKLITGECLQVYANRIRLFGRDRGREQTLGEVREGLGVVSHDLAAGYQKRMSALDVVCSGFFDSVGLYRQADAGQLAAARCWLDQMDLTPLCTSPFNRLSQGQRQMVLIARAMVKSPRLLLLDEPCSGLDEHNRRLILDLVSRIGRTGDTGLIFVSHHESEIPACTTHRLCLERGVVAGCGTVQENNGSP